MAEQIRCPHCGATNRADAEWCGQCYERLIEPEPEPEPEPAPVETAQVATVAETAIGEVDPTGSLPPATPSPEGSSTSLTIPEAAVGTQRGAFKVTEAGIVWTCARCETQNPLEATVCTVCGALFAETVRPPVERIERDPGTAALASLFMPGAGHAYLGQWGQAIARAALSLWAIFVVIISLLQRGENGSMLIAVVFGLIATALWAVSAHDAYREARFEEHAVLLKGRAFLFLVLGMLMLLMILLTVSGMSARD